MRKSVINKVVLSVLIVFLEIVLCACSSNRNDMGQEPILEETDEELTYAEEDSDIEDSLMEDSSKEETPQEETETSVEDETFIRGSIPDGSREVIKYLFDSIYTDQTDIYDIELYETEEELYYKYWFKSPYTGEIDEAPTYLCYFRATSDGLYQEYVVYVEILDTYYDENGNAHKKHFRNSIGNFFLINTSTREVIPQWIYNSDAEDDASYCIDNDRYWEVIDRYHGEKTENDNTMKDIYNQVMEGDLTALSQLENYDRIVDIYEKHRI